MHRLGFAVAALVVSVAGPRVAAADPTQLGAFFGPRLFSDDSRNGYIEENPAHPMLENAIAFGVRVARPIFPYFVPEFELGMAKTSTPAIAATPQFGGADATSVFWLEPRVQMRFEVLPERRVMPFFLIGGSAPIVLSSAQRTFNSGITGAGHVGAGVRFDSRRGFALRFDARVSMLPGAERYVAYELDFNVGLELHIGGKKKKAAVVIPLAGTADRDGDGILDKDDRCPDREEDADGFEDLDGCPDIDNDNDTVLDIADKCPMVPETYNGFEDDDGCPDTLPPEVEALKGTIEGLLYAEGETVVRDSAKPNLDKIAKLMAAQPTIKVLLHGHTDDREANQFAPKVDPKAPVDPAAPDAGTQGEPDFAGLAMELSVARAEAVKQVLIGMGVSGPRIIVEGKGAEEPVSENDKPRGRLANRRVEIRLYIPPRARQ